MRTIAIIQARVGSTRLRGKVLKMLAGKPDLVRCVIRTRRTKMIDDVVVATTIKPADNAVADLCSQQGFPCFRGSEEDVLDRYYRAAVEFQADNVVRITADCPLIEPEVIDQVLARFLAGQKHVDYASNFFPRRTYPIGLEVEVMRFDVLKKIWVEDQNPAWREHVTPYIYNNPELFNIQSVSSRIDYSHLRWTLDTLEDLIFIRQIYDHFGHDLFCWTEVLALLEHHPEWLEINQHVQQKVV